jgi:trk system potassium uptake protein
MSTVLRPTVDDLRLIGFYLGKVMTGLGVLMLAPVPLALVRGEFNALSALVVGAGLALTVGALADAHLETRRTLTWAHGMVIVALTWIVGAMFVAVPMHLSGRFDSPVSSLFESVSALTTTGMSLVHDLDHLESSMGLFRHLLQGAGGLGIIIVILALFSAGGSRVSTLYASEARDERIVPNVLRTSRFIARVTGAFLVAGVGSLTLALLLAGFGPLRALEHAVALFLASFSTGGFSLMQASMAYYHSASVELIVMVLMFAGMLSFAIHHALWSGDVREFRDHLETRTLALTSGVLLSLLTFGLVSEGTYTTVAPLIRKGLFTFLSAVSSTGHQVNVGESYLSDWGVLAPAALVGAMAIGGMASSTAGGIKALRVGLAVKAVLHDIRRFLLPESAVVVTTYHVGRRRILRPETARAATTVLLLYIVSYLIGTMTALAYGDLDVTQALFEAVSIGSNIGISIGVVVPGMPTGLQLVYTLLMILGRLEFVAVLVLVGYGLSFRADPAAGRTRRPQHGRNRRRDARGVSAAQATRRERS